jgi:diguanylate cyclase (GGDEF)-like protein
VSEQSQSSLPRILIVDDSRIVRATIIKRIRDRFNVREETDGEAGWEALLVDPTLQLVVTDHAMPRLDGYGLIERIRSSRVARIRDMPVIMISGDEDEESRQRAKDLGATDFITKGIGTAELLARLDSLVSLGRTQGALQAAQADALNDPLTGILAKPALVDRSGQVLAFAHRHGGNAGVLLIGLDQFDELNAQAGQSAADTVLRGFAELLVRFVRKEDTLGSWHRERFAVVTPGIDGQHAVQFAERLRAALANAAIEHAGGSVRPTATIGVASFPEDGQDLESLAATAEKRLEGGLERGGNRVEGGDFPASASVGGEASIDEALAALAAGRVDEVRARLPALGFRMMPLLGLLAAEYRFEVPMSDILRRLAASDAQVHDGVSTT